MKMSGKMAANAFVTFLAGDGDESWKAVVELAERLREVGSPCPLVVAVPPDVPEARRRTIVSQGCIVREVENHQAYLAMAADYVANFSKFVEYERLVYVNPVMNTTSGDGEAPAWPTAELGMVTAKALQEALRAMSPTPVAHHQDFLNMFFKDHQQYRPIQLQEKLAPSMLANKASKCPFADKLLPPFGSWLATTKEVIFARENLPAVATLAASSAAAGVITTAANPAICFGFYAVFIAAIAFVTISLREI